MKIEKLTKLKSGKYKLVFDNEEELVTYDDVIINNNLLSNKEITNELLSKVELDHEYYDIYNKVIKFISIRIRSEKEILAYLEKNQTSPNARDSIVTKLKEIGLINDERFARAYAADKLHLSNLGPDKIKSDLVNHDIDLEIINSVIEDLDQELINEKLEKLILKQIKINKRNSSYQLQQKITFDLVNKGYPRDLVKEILSQVEINDDDALNREYTKFYNRLSKKYKDKELVYNIKQKLYQKGFDIHDVDRIINEKIEG